jgi:hypothetical protein
MGHSLCKDLSGNPGPIRLTFREIDHCLFGTAEVEGGPSPVHSLADRTHIGIGVFIQELKEKAEIHRVPPVGSSRKKEDVVTGIPKEFTEAIT